MSTKPEKNIIVKDNDPSHPTSAIIRLHLLTKSGEPLEVTKLTYVIHPADDHSKTVDPDLRVLEELDGRVPRLTITTYSKEILGGEYHTSKPGKYFVEFKDSKTDLQGFGVEFEIAEAKKDFSFDKGKSTIEIDHPIIYFTDKQ